MEQGCAQITNALFCAAHSAFYLAAAATRRYAKPIYRATDGCVLGRDAQGHLNYVEPHGITAHCPRCGRDVGHVPIPYSERDASGCWLKGTP